MSSPYIKVEGISKRFGGNHVLTEIDFEARESEIVGLIGPNGSGKSTLLNLISGVHRPDLGRIYLTGKDVTRSSPSHRARLGLARTFQHDMSFPDLSVAQNLKIAVDMRRDETSTTAETLADYVGLPTASRAQPARDLSWGQGRMLGIAMGLAINPRMLLLDEPFAGLQRMAAQQVITLIERVRNSGIGVVIVEHEMSLLLPMCDRVVVLANGKVLAEGTPSEVVEDKEVIGAYFGTAV